MRTPVKRPGSLWWFEPRWSFRPRLKALFFEIFRLWMWVRIFVVAFLFTILAAYIVKRKFPDLEFNWVASFIYSFCGLVIVTAVFFVYFWFVPPIIRINQYGVHRQEGNHGSWRPRADIQRMVVDRTVAARPQLHIEAVNRKPFDCGIGAKLSADALMAFLRETFPERLVEERK